MLNWQVDNFISQQKFCSHKYGQVANAPNDDQFLSVGLNGAIFFPFSLCISKDWSFIDFFMVNALTESLVFYLSSIYLIAHSSKSIEEWAPSPNDDVGFNGKISLFISWYFHGMTGHKRRWWLWRKEKKDWIAGWLNTGCWDSQVPWFTFGRWWQWWL